jgi:hypothetical protein
MIEDKDDLFRLPSYEIGKWKPPVDRQFVKGKSGNPQGRPKKKAPDRKVIVDQSTMQQVLKAARQQVTVREGEHTKSITAFEAIIQAYVVGALKGKSHAQKNLLELMDRCLKEEAVEIQQSNEVWKRYVENYDTMVSSMKKTGEPISEDWPHPDDIVFEEGKYVQLRGGDPVTAAQTRKALVRFRDTLLVQAEMDRRCFPKGNPKDRPPIFFSDVLMSMINSSLPVRMQLDDVRLILRIMRLRTLRKHELQQQLQRDWTGLGITVGKNVTTPSVEPLIAMRSIDVAKLATAKIQTHYRKRA